jgi:hypothetical protein
MRALLFTIAMLAACSPQAPEAPREPARDVDFSVTTMASTADRRFLVEFRSLSDRELCISANDWPTAQGELGHNRSVASGDEVHRVGAGENLVAFVRFDQVPREQRSGQALQQVDFVPAAFFCGSAAQ